MLELEWRIPWPADWDEDKKLAAAERLAGYIKTGSIHDRETRMRVVDVQVVRIDSTSETATDTDPYIIYKLER